MIITTKTLYVVQDTKRKKKQMFNSEAEAVQHVEDLLGKEIDKLVNTSGHWSPQHKLDLMEWLQYNGERLCDLLRVKGPSHKDELETDIRLILQEKLDCEGQMDTIEASRDIAQLMAE